MYKLVLAVKHKYYIHMVLCQLYFGSVTALYMRARDRSAQGPGFSLGGPDYIWFLK